MLGMQNEREWVAFCDGVLEMPELAGDERFDSVAKRSTNRAELKTIIEGVFMRMEADEVMGKLEKAGVANAAVNDMEMVWKHPQLEARKRWGEVDSPVGKIKSFLPPGIPADFEPRMDAVPAVGQHNAKILREFGIKEEGS